MRTARRAAVVVLLVVVAAALFTAWQVYRVQKDLSQVQTSAKALAASYRSGDDSGRSSALSEFRLSADAAHQHTDGAWWSFLTHVPFLGDDAEGIQVLSRVLDNVAGGGVQPLVDSLDSLDDLSTDGQINLEAIAGLQTPVAVAHSTFETADREVGSLDSSGYAGVLRTRFDDFADQLHQLTDGLAAADTATKVLPSFLGADEERNYLVVFQNNAEIRASGGNPGSWAEIRADQGAVRIVRQGTAVEFGPRSSPVLPLTSEEQAVYSDLLGLYFQDATFTPDFPRAAEIMAARWSETYPDRLDGVISLDPVALSYLLAGTGPVKANSVTLRPDNAVEELLNKPYERFPEQEEQDGFFAAAARSIFTSVTSRMRSPINVARGLVRAADEGRFLVAPFRTTDADLLADSQVLGAVPDDDGTSPHVFVGLNDATGAKMSYYLRYRADVDATSCAADGTQSLLGTMTMDQTISKQQAAGLPDPITGGGLFGVEVGTQLVAVRLYGPTGGTVSDIKINGAAVQAPSVMLDNRPVVTLVITLDGSDDVVITWGMATGPDQSGDGSVGVTPSVVPGSKGSTFSSAC